MANTEFSYVAAKKASPFAARPNESLVYVNVKPDQTQMGGLTLDDLDKLILSTVNRALVTTADILIRHLLHLGLQNTDSAVIRTRLQLLVGITDSF